MLVFHNKLLKTLPGNCSVILRNPDTYFLTALRPLLWMCELHSLETLTPLLLFSFWEDVPGLPCLLEPYFLTSCTFWLKETWALRLGLLWPALLGPIEGLVLWKWGNDFLQTHHCYDMKWFTDCHLASIMDSLGGPNPPSPAPPRAGGFSGTGLFGLCQTDLVFSFSKFLTTCRCTALSHLELLMFLRHT